jgi:hypothetical protein
MSNLMGMQSFFSWFVAVGVGGGIIGGTTGVGSVVV